MLGVPPTNVDDFRKSTPIFCNLRHSVTISMTFSKFNFLKNSISIFCLRQGVLGVSPTIGGFRRPA